MKQPLLLLILALIAFSGCRSTKKAFEQGDYERAVINSIERLRRAPDNKKSFNTLKDAYPALVDYYQEQIDIAKRSPNPLRWENVIEDYRVLNRVYDEIQRSPSAKRAVPNARNYTPELNESLLKGAEARYALGFQDLERGRQGDRDASKQAYYHFTKALELRPGFRDAQNLSLEAQDLATLYVQVEPIPMHSRTFALSNEFFENQMVEYFRSVQFSPFIRFFTPREAALRQREPDQIIRMQFDDFVVGQAYVKETVIQRVRDSVVVGKVTIAKDSTVNAYGTVKAEVHRFQKEISSGGLLDVRILDVRREALLSQKKFPGTFVYYDYWGFFNGDERALEEDDKRFLRKRQPGPDPLPQDLFIEFTKPIYSQVTDFIAAYYRNY